MIYEKARSAPVEPPPPLDVHLTPDERCRLALKILRELAETDPDMATRLRKLGLDKG